MFRVNKIEILFNKKEVDKNEGMEKLSTMMNAEMERTIKSLARRYKIDEKEAINYVMIKEVDNNNIKRRGRPKGEEKEKKEKGPRGRPPMEEKMRTSNVGEDLIARLIAKAKSEYMQE
jgi:hypothetical protein